MKFRLKKKHMKEVLEAIDFTVTYSEESPYSQENAKGDKILRRAKKKLKKQLAKW